MSKKFRWSIQRYEHVECVTLSGVLDDDSDLAELVLDPATSLVILEMAEVERINSCGARDWVSWLGALEAKGIEVVLSQCSPAVVAQLNSAVKFGGTSAVKSFYIPYYCAECDQEKVLLCEASEALPGPYQPPASRCDVCDLVMEFDDTSESYFGFLVAALSGDRREALREFFVTLGCSSEEAPRVQSPVVPKLHAGSPSAKIPTVPRVPEPPSPECPDGEVSAKSGSGGVGTAIAGASEASSRQVLSEEGHSTWSASAFVALTLCALLLGLLSYYVFLGRASP